MVYKKIFEPKCNIACIIYLYELSLLLLYFEYKNTLQRILFPLERAIMVGYKTRVTVSANITCYFYVYLVMSTVFHPRTLRHRQVFYINVKIIHKKYMQN